MKKFIFFLACLFITCNHFQLSAQCLQIGEVKGLNGIQLPGAKIYYQGGQWIYDDPADGWFSDGHGGFSLHGTAKNLITIGSLFMSPFIATAFNSNRMGTPVGTEIPWDKVTPDGYTWQGHDGDIIFMKELPGNEGQLIFMQTGTWWKGIVAFNKEDTNNYSELACLKDNKKTHVINITKEVADYNYIVLSKAKTLGVHSNMYWIQNWKDIPSNKNYLMLWMHD